MFCEIYLQSATHITKIHDLFILFSRFFTDSRCLNLEVLLIKIVLFLDYWSNQLFQSNQRFQAMEFVDQPAQYGISVLWIWSAASRVNDSQVQSYPYKHIRDTHVMSDAYLKLLLVVVEG